MPILKRGLLQIYTGDGKGKTTAAFGLAWRMLGVGGKVYICQFLKPADLSTGEAELAKKFPDNLILDRLDHDWNMKKGLKDKQQAQTAHEKIAAKLTDIKENILQGQFDLVILDEIIFCLNNKLAEREQLQDLIRSRSGHTELVLTGRGADKKIIAQADLVTEMQLMKHPYQQGMLARKGIEY